MGSVGNQNQNPWSSPYNSYKDCTQSPICSINCPQFCYFFFPPPPSSDADSGPISPFIIAVIGVLAGAFLLVGYYTIVTRYCNRRPDLETNTINHQELIRHRAGLEDSLIREIAAREYRNGDGTECAVCLTDFREKEVLRILPKCGHAFHLPCIDTWLRSQSSCPLCRAGVVVLARPDHVALNIDAGPAESRREDSDLVLVVGDGGENGVRRFRRSVSLGAFPARRISDVGIGDGEKDMGIGSSVSCGGLTRSVSSCDVHTLV